MFVHFTIGLLGAAVVFYFASALLADDHKWKQQWQHMANWSLWSGCLVTTFTLYAGWYAYTTVSHDAASHAAMTLHRNWAVATAALFLILGLAAMSIARHNKTSHFIFLFVAAIAGIILMITGFLGGEAVYRHGLGVMSLPEVEIGTDGHQHDHRSQQPSGQPMSESRAVLHSDLGVTHRPNTETSQHSEHLDDADVKLEVKATAHEHHH
jgi:uncharacterized membrane protein